VLHALWPLRTLIESSLFRGGARWPRQCEEGLSGASQCGGKGAGAYLGAVTVWRGQERGGMAGNPVGHINKKGEASKSYLHQAPAS